MRKQLDDLLNDGVAGPAVTGDGQGSGYSCTYDWGHDAVGLNNIKMSVTRHESPEAAADAYAYHHDRVANAGADAGVTIQALKGSANSLTRVEQQTSANASCRGGLGCAGWCGHGRCSLPLLVPPLLPALNVYTKMLVRDACQRFADFPAREPMNLVTLQGLDEDRDGAPPFVSEQFDYLLQ